MIFKEQLANLKLRNKFLIFAILGVLLVTAPLVEYLRVSNGSIALAQRERDGIPAIQQLLRLMQLVQQHGGLAVSVLGGNAAVEPQRVAVSTAIDKASAILSGALSSGTLNAGVAMAWGTAQKNWMRLRSAAAEQTTDIQAIAAQHAELVTQLGDVMDVLADRYGLTLDGQLDSAGLIQVALQYSPQLTESLVQMRARSLLYRARQATLSAEERSEINTLAGLSRGQFRNMMRALEKSMGADELIADKIGAVTADGQRLYGQVLKLTREQSIDGTVAAPSSEEYLRVLNDALISQFKLSAAVVEALDVSLATRVASLREKRLWILAVVLLVALVAAIIGYAVATSISIPLQQASGMAQRFASGDLTGRSQSITENEMGRMFTALDSMRAGLALAVIDVRQVADIVGAASDEIANGNMDLSRRTERQAATLEETASSMEQLTATVKQNTENASHASALADEASKVALSGGAAMSNIESTMKGISESSTKIAEITGVIDAIAFQTNILALNAAVEAARAGEQGRGFAVVAAEVRSLAQRSALAAKEIKLLIQEASGRVSSGAHEVGDAGKTMEEIVAAVNRVNSLIAQIARASAEQLIGIEQIDRAISEIDGNTQQNAAVVEQAAASAQEMAGQAQHLIAAVAKFKLEEWRPSPKQNPAQLHSNVSLADEKPNVQIRAFPRNNREHR